MPDETLSPEQAQAQLDAFYNDPNRPWDTRTQEEAEQALEWQRIAHGSPGRAIVAEYGGTTAPADYSPQPVTPGSPPDTPTMDMQPLTTAETAVDLASELGLEKEDMTKLLQWEASQPRGQHSKEERLHGFDPTERDRLNKAFEAGLERLPVSMQVHLERRGLIYSPRVFRELVGLGMYLQDLDEEIGMEAQKNPASPRLRELLLRRRGRQNVQIF